MSRTVIHVDGNLTDSLIQTLTDAGFEVDMGDDPMVDFVVSDDETEDRDCSRRLSPPSILSLHAIRWTGLAALGILRAKSGTRRLWNTVSQLLSNSIGQIAGYLTDEQRQLALGRTQTGSDRWQSPTETADVSSFVFRAAPVYTRTRAVAMDDHTPDDSPGIDFDNTATLSLTDAALDVRNTAISLRADSTHPTDHPLAWDRVVGDAANEYLCALTAERSTEVVLLSIFNWIETYDGPNGQDSWDWLSPLRERSSDGSDLEASLRHVGSTLLKHRVMDDLQDAAITDAER